MQLDVSVVHAAEGEGVEAAVVLQNICAPATAGRPDNGCQNVLSGLLAASRAPAGHLVKMQGAKRAPTSPCVYVCSQNPIPNIEDHGSPSLSNHSGGWS